MDITVPPSSCTNSSNCSRSVVVMWALTCAVRFSRLIGKKGRATVPSRGGPTRAPLGRGKARVGGDSRGFQFVADPSIRTSVQDHCHVVVVHSGFARQIAYALAIAMASAKRADFFLSKAPVSTASAGLGLPHSLVQNLLCHPPKRSTSGDERLTSIVVEVICAFGRRHRTHFRCSNHDA